MPNPDGHEPTFWVWHRKIRDADPAQPTCEKQKRKSEKRSESGKENDEKENDASERNGDQNDETKRESESEKVPHEGRKLEHPPGDATKRKETAKVEEKDARWPPTGRKP